MFIFIRKSKYMYIENRIRWVGGKLNCPRSHTETYHLLFFFVNRLKLPLGAGCTKYTKPLSLMSYTSTLLSQNQQSHNPVHTRARISSLYLCLVRVGTWNKEWKIMYPNRASKQIIYSTIFIVFTTAPSVQLVLVLDFKVNVRSSVKYVGR